MLPFERPFLDYILSGLADAGLTEVCLVIGPEHDAVRQYYAGAGRPRRVALRFAIQERPLGTADAVRAAEACSGGASFVALNADNLYPTDALAALRGLPRAGLLGFRRSGLLRSGDIPADRIIQFALIETAADGTLARIVEKPDPGTAAGFGPDPLVSMNAWLLPPTIFDACRAIVPSGRGELELQDAVRYGMAEQGERYRVIERDEAVLDLSTRADIPRVAGLLRGREARP
jgi:glucose-1-phosphate thymidylyltransferase